LLFVASLSLCPLPLSYACLLSSSTGRAIVDEAAEGQSPMQSPPIFVEMEPAIIRHCLALRLALVAACQQAVFWCVTWFHPVWDTKYQKKSHLLQNLRHRKFCIYSYIQKVLCRRKFEFSENNGASRKKSFTMSRSFVLLTF
jgi:hypothetical protein